MNEVESDRQYSISEAIRQARLQLMKFVRQRSRSPALVNRLRAEELALQEMAPLRDDPMLSADEYRALIDSIKAAFRAQYKGCLKEPINP